MTGPEKLASLAAEYQELLHGFCSDIIVHPCREYQDDVTAVLSVFFIPDERLHEFMIFRAEQLPKEVEHRQLPEVSLIPVCASDTKEFYPGFTRINFCDI